MSEVQLPKLGGDTPTNPSQFFAEWQGDRGVLYYYDKEEKVNVDLPKDFKFIVLDQLNTVAGFKNDEPPKGRPLYSNEVRDLRYEPLNVRVNKRSVARGLWSEIKDGIKAMGGKFAKSIYIAYRDDDKVMRIGCIKASGAFMSEWFDFTKRNASQSGGVAIVGTESRVNGKIEYVVPVFKMFTVPDDSYAEATALLTTLKDYLHQYFSYVPEQGEDSPELFDESEPVDDPFNNEIQVANEMATAPHIQDDVDPDDIGW